MLAEIFGPDLLIVVLIVVVVLFGGAAIPKLARNLGSAKSEFEKGVKTSHESTDAPKEVAKPASGGTPTTNGQVVVNPAAKEGGQAAT
jgi:TatA/E family protein of Tat protein translocase